MNDKVKHPKRVGYVFSADTVEKLEQLSKVESPIYNGRPATWIVEYAIHELWYRVVKTEVQS